jgi:hypothetical protein
VPVHLDSIVPVLASGVLSVAAPLSAQRPRADSLQRNTPAYDIAYAFEARSPATHEATVRLRIAGALGDSTLIQLPAWYPGRYAIYNFAANVQQAHASCDGRSVPAPKRDKQTWVVRCKAPRQGRATIEFTLGVWWNDLNGSTSQIDCSTSTRTRERLPTWWGTSPIPSRHFRGPTGGL